MSLTRSGKGSSITFNDYACISSSSFGDLRGTGVSAGHWANTTNPPPPRIRVTDPNLHRWAKPS